MGSGRARCAAFAVALSSAAVAQGGPPAPGTCPQLSRAAGSTAGGDAAAPLLQEGQALAMSDLLLIERLIPPELWRNRETFFYEGMRLEVGGCHRDYPPSPAYQTATAKHAGTVHVDQDGNLRDYQAGRPFPAESIDMKAPDAAVKWAWNFEERDRGAGAVGSFRIFDLPSGLGTPQTYTGSFFFVRTSHRADLPESNYEAPAGGKNSWVAGGSFDEPFDARHLAWRQFRPDKAAGHYKEPDDTFVYVPTMRKVRRAATSWWMARTPRYLLRAPTREAVAFRLARASTDRPARSNRRRAFRSPPPRICGAASSASRSVPTRTSGASRASARCWPR
jgi:hypothetical protein